MTDEEQPETEPERLLEAGDGGYNPPPSFDDFIARVDVDLAPWLRAKAELDTARQSANEADRAGATRYLLRAAAVETGAIEGLYSVDRGFTFSVASDTLAVEQMAVEQGEDFVRHFDAQLLSFEMALDAATSTTPISESWLRQLHAATVAGQDVYRVMTDRGTQERALPRGEYKNSPNHVLLRDGSVHSYAPVAETPFEVRRVIDEFRTDSFQRASGVLQAAYAHYALVGVHPFSDGNGRVSRSLASVFLLREASVPLFIYSDQTAQYLDALAAADSGNLSAFATFVRDRAIGVARLSASAPELDRSYEDLDAHADAIMGRLKQKIEAAFADRQLPPQMSHEVQVGEAADQVLSEMVPEPSPQWRTKTNKRIAQLRATLQSAPPAKATVNWRAIVLIATGGDRIEAFRIVGEGQPELIVGLDEVLPEVSHELDLRLSNLAERTADRLVRQIAEAVSKITSERGY